MNTVGAYEAKTHLSELLKRVENGESITITKHGVPIAILQPFGVSSRDAIRETIDEILEFRKKHPLKDINIKKLIEEGRRY